MFMEDVVMSGAESKYSREEKVVIKASNLPNPFVMRKLLSVCDNVMYQYDKCIKKLKKFIDIFFINAGIGDNTCSVEGVVKYCDGVRYRYIKDFASDFNNNMYMIGEMFSSAFITISADKLEKAGEKQGSYVKFRQYSFVCGGLHISQENKRTLISHKEKIEELFYQVPKISIDWHHWYRRCANVAMFEPMKKILCTSCVNQVEKRARTVSAHDKTLSRTDQWLEKDTLFLQACTEAFSQACENIVLPKVRYDNNKILCVSCCIKVDDMIVKHLENTLYSQYNNILSQVCSISSSVAQFREFISNVPCEMILEDEDVFQAHNAEATLVSIVKSLHL